MWVVVADDSASYDLPTLYGTFDTEERAEAWLKGQRTINPNAAEWYVAQLQDPYEMNGI